MATLGRSPGAAPLTSADIPDDSITAAKIVDGAIDFQDEIGFLENKATTQNLSGTYSTERMYLNDSYTLTGDVTVTGHLALGTVADADVVITQDSTERTITGSGTLESGELLSSKETDLNGMTGSPAINLGNSTGVLPVGVTGGSGLTALGTVTAGNLSNTAIVYPAGHVLGVEALSIGPTVQNSTTSYVTCMTDSITVKSATSNILIMIQVTMGTQTASNNKAVVKVTEDSGNGVGLGNTGTTTDDYVFCTLGCAIAPSGHGQQSDIGYYHLHDHNAIAGQTLTYKVWFRSSASGEYVYFNNYGFSPDGTEKSSMVLMEIAT